MQEDFPHHELLFQEAKSSTHIVRGVTEDFLKCWVCYGSGLMLIEKLHKLYRKIRDSFIPFEKFSGWLNRSNDCFAQKGFQLIVLESKGGHRTYMVGAHLDAEGNKIDREVRASQLDKIAVTLEAKTVGDAWFLRAT